MSTTFTMMRLCVRMQNPGRIALPHTGYAGVLYPSLQMENYKSVYQNEAVKTTGSPAFAGAHKLLVQKGAMGSYHFRRAYSTSVSVDDVKKAQKKKLDRKKAPKLMTAETAKIMLISETGSISAMTLEQANSLAKKKRLDLVHIVNDREKPVRTGKEVYRLVSRLSSVGEEEEEETEELSKSKDAKQKVKEEKTVLLKSNTGEHDINSKVNMMLKWLKKGHRIKVMIGQAGEKGDAETVFRTIESKVGEAEGQVQQKILKGNEIRFYIGPPKTKSAIALKTNNNKNTKAASKPGDEDDDDGADSDSETNDFRKGRQQKQ